MRLFSPFDFLLIFAVCGFSFLLLVGKNQKDDSFEIYFDGKIIEIPLSKDTNISINSVEIELKNQTAKITKSSCPNQICVASPALNSDGQIVCVPNKVIVSLHKKKTEIDVYVQ
jgi:hypothetical protein